MRLFCAVVVVGVLTLTLTVPIQGQQFHRNPFESRDVLWQKGAADAPVQNERHELTTQTAHSGQQSEAIRFTADSGT
jgi:hypothetical protein